MASACALAIFSGIIIFISRLSRSAERSKRIFTGGVVTANGICSAAFCESAALRLAGSPSPSSLRDATSPKGRGLGIAVQFPAEVQSLRVCPLPLGGAVAQRLRGRGRLRGRYPLSLTSFGRFPLLSLRDIFPRSGGSRPSRGNAFALCRQLSRHRKKLPLRGSWHRAAMTERVSRPLGEGGCDQREQTEGVRPASRFALELETFPPCQRLPPRGSCQSRQALTEGVPNSHPICKLKMQLFCVLRRFSAILRQCKKLCGFCLTGGCLRVIMNT